MILIKEDIKKNPTFTQFLIIAGDVFERKDNITTDEIDCFHYMMKETQTIPTLKTIMIPGNHDFKKASEMDCISSVLINTKYNNVYHYPRSGVYTHDAIDFYVHSPMDNIIPFKMATSTNPKIALVHEPVIGCQYFKGNERLRLRADELSAKFNITMLGDIHIRHRVMDLPNIAYSGSFVQKTKAEGLYHGCIRWTIDDKHVISFSSITFKQINVYVLIEANNNKVERVPLQVVESASFIKLLHFNCTTEKLEKIQETVKAQLGRIDMVQDKTTMIKASKLERSPETMNTLMTKDISNLDLQLEILHDLLEKNNQLAYYPKIKAMHTERYTVKTNNRLKWKLLKLEWSNLYCYGEGNVIDFEHIGQSATKVASLVGRNKTGKSAILDILLLALYNKASRGSKKSIIRKGAKAISVKCTIGIGNTKYRIEQTEDINEHPNATLYEIQNGVARNISGAGTMATYAKLKQIIGSKKQLLNVNIAMQGSQLYPDMNDSDQKKILTTYFDLDMFDDIAAIITTECTALKTKINDNITKLNAVNIAALGTKEFYEAKIKEFEFRVNNISDEIHTIHDKMSEISFESTENDIKDIETIRSKLLELELMDMQPVSDDEIQRITVDIANLTFQLEQLKKTIDNNLQEVSRDELIKITQQLDEIGPSVKRLMMDFLNRDSRESLILSLIPVSTNVLVKLKDLKPLPQLDKEKTKLFIKNQTDIIDSLQSSMLSFNRIKVPDKHTKQSVSARLEVLSSYMNLQPDENASQLQSTIDSLKAKISEIPKQTIIKQTKYDELTIDKMLSELANFKNLEVMYIEPSTLIELTAPLKPVEDLASLPELYNKEAAIKRSVVKLKSMQEINPDIKSIFKWNKECSCCGDNEKLFDKDKSQLDIELAKYRSSLTATMDMIRQFEAYQTAYGKYQEKLAIYNNAVKAKERNDNIALYKACSNDKKFFIAVKNGLEAQALQKQLDAASNELKQNNDIRMKQIEYDELKNIMEAIKHNDTTDQEIAKLKIMIENIKLSIKQSQTDLDDYIEYEMLREQQIIEQKNIIIREQLSQLDTDLKIINKFNQLSERRDYLLIQLDKLKKRDDLLQCIGKTEIELTTLKEKHKNLSDNIDNSKLLALYTKELTLLTVNKQRFEAKEIMRKKLHALEHERNSKNIDIKEFTRSLVVLARHAEISQDIKNYREELTYKTMYKKHISIDNGISDILLRRYAKSFEADVNAILDQLTDFTIHFNLAVTESDPFLYIIQNLNKIPATQASGFQKFIITLAIRIALAKNHPKLPSFLILDEGFGCMDNEHLTNVIEFLHQINATQLDWLLFVSHIPEMRSISASQIAVASQAGISKVIQ
jgi:DNA repair exonuclease SbcCD ATPase subunit